MEEGTSSPTSTGSLPNPQNSWETPPTVFPAQNVPEPAPLPDQGHLGPDPAKPFVYRPTYAPPTPESNEGRGGSRIKKILKLGIGLFVVLTILFVIIAMIIPKFSKPESKDITLTYWGLFEDPNTIKPVIDEFEKENPHIKIDYVKQDPTDYRERLTVRAANGNGPDIFRFHNTWYPMLSGILLPLPNETIEKSEFNNNYYNVAKSDLIKNGTIYGIPLMTDTLSLYINTQLFDQPSGENAPPIPVPKTWQEFIDAATQLTQRDDTGAITIAGAGIGTYDNVNHAPDIISLIMAQNGVDLGSPSGYGDKISDALRFYTNFANVEGNVWDNTQDSTLVAFTQGKLAMYFGYSWDYFPIKAQNPNLQVKIVPVPQLVADQKVNIASYWAEGVSSKSKHPKEALIFMKYLAQQDTQEKLYTEELKTRAYGEPYSYISLADKLKDTTPFVFADQSTTAVSSPFVDGTGDNGLNTKLNVLLKTAINGLLSQDQEESVTQALLQGYSQVVAEQSGRATK